MATTGKNKSLIERIFTPRKKAKRVVEKIVTDFNYRVRSDIRNYQLARAEAANGNYVRIQKFYKKIMEDLHLSAVIDLRKEYVLGTPFTIKYGNSTIDRFNKKWFYDFMSYALDAIYFGYSLIQIDGIVDNNVSSVTLIPREFVNINEGVVYEDLITKTPYDYTTKEVYKWLVEVVNMNKPIGALADIIPIVIWKRQAMAAWSEYAEIFGMPIRIGRTTSTIEEDRRRLEHFLKELASSAYAVIDESEQIEFIETARTDAYNVYERLISTMNSEISKRILGGTEITDSSTSSGYAQGKVHDKQLEMKIRSDMRWLEYVINDILFPKLKQLGVLKNNAVFTFDTFENLTLLQQIDIDKTLNEIAPLDKKYLEDKYRVKFDENGQ